MEGWVEDRYGPVQTTITMRVLIVVLFVCLTGQSALAQVFPLDTIIYHGPAQSKINFVFLGDGFREDEIESYISQTRVISETLFNITPFKEYKDYFNVFAIRVVSNESGATHPQSTDDPDCPGVPVITVDNYFGSQFDYAGIHRLLVSTKPEKVAAVLASNFSFYDQAFLLVNSPYYGGSGGVYATGSMHEESVGVALHELGHSFGWLADEYWTGSGYEAPNMTQEEDSTLVKWRNWLGTEEVGIYPYESTKVWFRPSQSCKMLMLGGDFCPVCKENLTRQIHSYIPPMKNYRPSATEMEIGMDSIAFSVEVSTPASTSYYVAWKVDGQLMEEGALSFSLAKNQLSRRQVLVEVEVHDTTLTRLNPPFHQGFNYAGWLVTNPEMVMSADAGIPLSYNLSVYPNPVLEQLHLSYTLATPQEVNITLVDTAGKKLSSLSKGRQLPGTYQLTFNTADVLPGAAGMYLLQIEVGGQVMVKRLIRLSPEY